MDLVDFNRAFRARSEEIGKTIQECRTFLRSSQAKEAKLQLDLRVPPPQQAEWDLGFFANNYSLYDSKVFDLGYWYWKKVQNDDQLVEIPVPTLLYHPLTFPYRDLWGNPVGLCGRTILNKEQQTKKKISKYKYTRDLDKSYYCYGLNKAKSSILDKGFAIVVEGQIDCISSHAAGMTNTVAVGGSDLSEHQFRQLRLFTDRIVLAFDPDAAGRAGAAKAIERYCEDAEIQYVNFNEGSDIDELLKSDKKQEIMEQINKAGGR